MSQSISGNSIYAYRYLDLLSTDYTQHCSRIMPPQPLNKPFQLEGYPGTGNAEVPAALDLEGPDRQSRCGPDWAPDDQLHRRQGLKVVGSGQQQSVYKAVLGIASAGTFGP